MTNEELKEAYKTCVKVTATFTNPKTGEEKTFEETGSYFFGGVLTDHDGQQAYSGASMGGAAAIEIAAMHRQLLKTMAETTAKSPELAMIMMDDMLDEEPKKASSRSNVMEELLKASSRSNVMEELLKAMAPPWRRR